jgi:hypothetical protein
LEFEQLKQLGETVLVLFQAREELIGEVLLLSGWSAIADCSSARLRRSVIMNSSVPLVLGSVGNFFNPSTIVARYSLTAPLFG